MDLGGYVFDFDRLDEYILNDRKSKNSISTIVDSYGANDEGKMDFMSREISETKNVTAEQQEGQRWEFVKMLIIAISEVSNPNKMGFFEKLSLASLIGSGIIKKIDKKKDNDR